MPNGDEIRDPKVKGIDTGQDPTQEGSVGLDNLLPTFNPKELYNIPTTEQNAVLSERGKSIIADKSASYIPGKFTSGVDSDIFKLYGDINLASAIPDQYERAKYIDEHGDKFIKGLDPDTFKIAFNDDVLDYSRFVEQKYNREQKKFLDDLDENQGFFSELGNTLAKTVGLTANAVTGLIPLTYGLAKGLFTLDAQNIFNNELFDQWERQDDYLNKKFAVYGGSDYHSGDKGFGARFKSNFMKSLNADIAPAAAFVAGAVLTEVAAGALSAATGGTAIASNTARVAAQATRLFGSGARNVAKGMKVIRGIDNVSDFQKAKQIVNLTQKYRAGIGTASSMVRSSGYESSLIARDTYKSAETKGYINYLNSDPALKNKAETLVNQGYTDEQIIETLKNEVPKSIRDRIAYQAEQAGELAWFTNVPLVGASNLIQFSKAFGFNYKLGRNIAKGFNVNPLRGTKTVGGKIVARADEAGKLKKVLGYGMVAGKGALTEGFEEFSQGVIQEGYSDYYASAFSDEALQTSSGFLDAQTKAASKYWNSTEGKDSMLIGSLMGMIGIGLPVKIDTQTGKPKLGFQWYGGAYQEIKELKAKIKEDQFNAKTRNEQPLNKVLRENFQNQARHITIQKEMDEALQKGDLFNFKNKEYEDYHSFVTNRFNVGLEETVFQDIDAMEKMPIEEFNRQYSFEGGEFTNETRKKSLDKLRKNTKNIIKAHKHVNDVFQDGKYYADWLRKNYKGLKDTEVIDGVKVSMQVVDGLREQMAFLYGSSMNLQEREEELTKQLNDLTKNSINLSVLNKIISDPRLAKITEKTRKEIDEEGDIVETKYKTPEGIFFSDAREFYKETLKEIKEQDPVNYDLHKKEIQSALKDLIKIKERRSKTAGIYSNLFTKKGGQNFVNLYASLVEASNKIYQEEAAKREQEDIKKSKSSNRVKRAAENEQSRTGENEAETAKVNAEIEASEEAIRKEVANLDPEGEVSQDFAELIEKVSPDSILEKLESSPALFNQILQYLESKGKPLPGVNNIDQLAEVFATNPNAVNDIVEAFKALNAQYRSVNEKPDPRLDYAETTESTDQKAPDPDTLETDEEGFDYFLNLEQKVRDQLGYDSESNVSDKSFIPVTHDKKLVKVKINGKDTYIVERGIDGSFNDWYIETRSGVISSNQPIDNAKINDPDFLSNKELKDNDVEATLIIPDTPYNQRLREQNKLTYENVEIHMMVGDTFIGTVPNIREEVSENFRALRQTVFNQQQGTTQGIQVATSINPKLKEILNGLGYSNTKIDSLTKEEIEYISKNKIPVEEFVSREENIKENFENITKQLEDLVKESIIPGSELNEMMSKFMDETGEFKKC